MVNLKHILETINEVKLNGNYSLVDSVLLLYYDGIEFGYTLDGYGYEVTKRFNHRELSTAISLYHTIYSTCEGMLITLEQKVLDNEGLRSLSKTSSGAGPIIF